MHRSFLPIVVALASLAGCARVRPVSEPLLAQQGTAKLPQGRVADHVIVISIDGLRPDAIAKYGAVTLRRMMREGRYSLTAQTIAISNTLPSHTSMLTGVDADQHKITWNKDKTGEFGHVEVPTVFGLAHAAGFRTAAFYSKSKFHHIDAPENIDHVRGPKGGVIPWNAQKVTDFVVSHLDKGNPNLTFVHLSDADFAGHNFGWMSHTYGMGVREADRAVERILHAADEKFGRVGYTVIVTSDHGGHNKSHGTTELVDTTIPWIIWGAGVQPGIELTGIRTMDTAATVLWILDVAPPSNFVGKAQSVAFEPKVAKR